MIGGQFQLWTEYIKDARTLDYMTFPRACAFAEVAWSGKPSLWSSSGSGLRGRVEAQLRRLDAAGGWLQFDPAGHMITFETI